MEALFLKVLNMSITASYVILIIIFIRLLLKKAPKKYSYLLWSVVLYRLICPISFSSIFSIFQAKLFNMTAATRNGTASLSFIPSDIGYMNTPKVTVGIPTMNSIISGSLPPATPYASVNPLQIWISLGTILWSVGIAVLLTYCIVTYNRLKQRVATSVILEGNVFESDKIRSPFILGFTMPRIYIPFGLGMHEKSYILQHESFHLKRKDHLIKPLCFCVLTIHWFNPLVWLAFVLMTKDMEMSCDEKVLSETSMDIVRDYSTSLLAFAANRRFPSASPLAFSEASIRQRIKNILGFKTPKKSVIVLTTILCAAAVIACAANPVKKAISTTNHMPYGNYTFEKQIYMNPLSSFMAFDGFEEYYTFTKNLFILTDATGIQYRFPVTYKQSKVDEKNFQNSFMIITGAPDIASYKKRYQYTLTGASSSTLYRIYQLDDELWLAKIHKNSTNTQKKEYIWSLFKITRFDGEIPLKVNISGTQDKVKNFLSLNKNFKSEYANDQCYNITPDDIRRSSDYLVFKYGTSCASFLLYKNKVYPLGIWLGGYGLTSMAVADLNNDKKTEFYFTYSFGSGLHRSCVAYFDPITKRIVAFNYAHLNKDMIITQNNDGGRGLSLYNATISNMKSFTNFEVNRKEFISNVVYEKGRISLNPIPNE